MTKSEKIVPDVQLGKGNDEEDTHQCALGGGSSESALETTQLINSSAHAGYNGRNSRCNSISNTDSIDSTDSKENIRQSEVSNTKSQSKSTVRKILTGIFVVSISASTYCGYSLIAPFFPPEAEAKGVSLSLIGWIIGIFPLVRFITSPFYGSKLNRFGVKKMFILGAVLYASSQLAFGLLSRLNDSIMFISLCFICRILQANGAAMVQTTSFAIMAVQFPHNIPIVLLGGYELPFIALSGFQSLCAAFALIALPAIAAAENEKGEFIDLLKIPDCLLIYCLITGLGIAITFVDPILSNYIHFTFGLPIGLASLIFMINSTIYAISAPIIGKISSKGWDGFMVMVGLILGGVSYILVAPSPVINAFIPVSLPISIISQVIAGISEVLVIIPMNPIIINLLRYKGYEKNIHTFGMIAGLFNSAQALGMFIGPVATGYLGDQMGFSWATTICGMFLFILACVMFMYIQIMRCKGLWPTPDPNE